MFETLTVPRPPKNRVAGPAAVLLHGAAVAGVFLITAWKVGDVGAPPIRIVFPVASLPQATGTPSSKGRSEGARPGRGFPSLRRAPVQPVSIGPIPAAAAATPLDSGTSSLKIAEFPVGGLDGPGAAALPGDDFGSPLPAEAPNVSAPRLLSQPQPEYPELSRRMKEQGVVVLRAVIGLDGRVEDVEILRGATRLLDAASVRAVREWRYAPATMNGRAIRVFLTATVRFTLR